MNKKQSVGAVGVVVGIVGLVTAYLAYAFPVESGQSLPSKVLYTMVVIPGLCLFYGLLQFRRSKTVLLWGLALAIMCFSGGAFVLGVDPLIVSKTFTEFCVFIIWTWALFPLWKGAEVWPFAKDENRKVFIWTTTPVLLIVGTVLFFLGTEGIDSVVEYVSSSSHWVQEAILCGVVLLISLWMLITKSILFLRVLKSKNAGLDKPVTDEVE